MPEFNTRPGLRASVYLLVLAVMLQAAAPAAHAEPLTAGHCEALMGFYRQEFDESGRRRLAAWQRATGSAASVYGALSESHRRLTTEQRAFVIHVLSGSASSDDGQRMRRMLRELVDSFEGHDQYRLTRCEGWPNRGAQSRDRDASKGEFRRLGSYNNADRKCTRDIGELEGSWVAVMRFPFLVHEGTYGISESIKPRLDRNIRFLEDDEAKGLADRLGIEVCEASSTDGVHELKICQRVALRDYVRMGPDDIGIDQILENNRVPVAFPSSAGEYASLKTPAGCRALLAARTGTAPRASLADRDRGREAASTGAAARKAGALTGAAI